MNDNTPNESAQEEDSYCFFKRACPHYRSLPEMFGYVYIIEHQGVYKIGKTKKLNRRLLQISPKLPYELKLFMVIESNNRHLEERWLHTWYEDKRLSGEWFALDAFDIASMILEGPVVSILYTDFSNLQKQLDKRKHDYTSWSTSSSESEQ